MAKSSYAATHSGECQLCGHIQKLPGGGLLSLHGYEVRWNSFQGTCPGSRNLPYEQSCDLLAGEVKRQQATVVRLAAWANEIASGKNVFVIEHAPSPKGYGYANVSIERELTPSEYEIIATKYSGWTSFKLVWTTIERGNLKAKQRVIDAHDVRSADALIAYANSAKIASINANIDSRKQYIQWLKARITNWKLRDLTALAPEEIGTKATTLHAVNGYWSKREGRDIALCVSSIRAAGYKVTTKDNAKVTCKACLKALAAQDAQAVLVQKRDALIAEMVAKFGEQVKVQFSDANEQAVKHIRYHRKDIDKDVRKAACERLERGVRS